jgi:hypothetical protein
MANEANTKRVQSIDYGGSAAEIAKAKQASHDADLKRLASEHPDHPDYTPPKSGS